MPKTVQANSPAKEKLLQGAQKLMLEKGYTATTVDEICEDAQLTKGSFFHYFESKEELGEEVLQHFFNGMLNKMRGAPFLKETDPLKRVYGYVDFIIQMSQDPRTPKSCLVGNFAQELSKTHSGIRSSCARMFSQWAEEFKRELDEARRKYAPKKNLDTLSIAEHFIAVLEGALILAKAKQDWGTMKENLLHYKRYLKSILEIGNK